MASHLFSPSLLPQQAQEKDRKDEAPSPLQEYGDLISKLPLEDGWPPFLDRQYQGFLIPEVFLLGWLAIQQHFKPRPDDLFLASCPKSGTTSCKALIFATMTRTQYPLAHHPLLSRSPHECVLFMDELLIVDRASKLEALPSPRMISTHMPYSLLPDSITRPECRIIYVARDPKDVFVSLWHYGNKMKPGVDSIPSAKGFELFCEARSPYAPVWGHILEYWRESLRRPQKVLFLKYEGMLEDPVGNVKRLAEFMGCPFSPEEEREGLVEGVIRLCSFEQLSRLDINRSGGAASVSKVPNFAFFRKGEAGDWRNHMTPEMASRLDGIVEEKLRGSGLSFGRMGSEGATVADNPLGSQVDPNFGTSPGLLKISYKSVGFL